MEFDKKISSTKSQKDVWVNIEFNEQLETIKTFEIVPYNCLSGVGISTPLGIAEICATQGDFFAIFPTDLGSITYIFMSDGQGFQIGPGTAQLCFSWN